MLFNSYAFLFVFFPSAFALFFLAARLSPMLAAGVLTLASLVFYGWWSVAALPLLLLSICANYFFGIKVTPGGPGAPLRRERERKTWFYAAIGANLGLLAFFKYANFFVENSNAILAALGAAPITAPHVVLPIGISFFTFTQIAFLVDCYQGKVKERNFIHYALFVSYFPHLIAGPILHHAQMMPQFAIPGTYRINLDKVAIGIILLTIGLSKKLLIADPLGDHADALFESVAKGGMPQLVPAWLGVFAYAFQIYFDFSAYSDMAIGLSLFFGIRLPVNFNSPYKATSIIDFWSRWHISLSAFLRSYLYIPLGGNRRGKPRRYVNLMITMLLGGLWHGASWTFVLWGALHGVMLVINHAWRAAFGVRRYGPAGLVACWALTFLGVCLAWVLFRSDSLTIALEIYRALIGLNGMLPIAHANGSALDSGAIGAVVAAATICLAFGNANKLPDMSLSTSSKAARWLLHPAAAFVFACLFVACVVRLSSPSPFLYFQF